MVIGQGCTVASFSVYKQRHIWVTSFGRCKTDSTLANMTTTKKHTTKISTDPELKPKMYSTLQTDCL